MDLTQKQIKALSNLLPKGFTLEPRLKPTKEQISSNPQKKLFLNETQQIVQKPIKTVVTPQEHILINKQALRDPGKRKVSSHLEFKFGEFDPQPTTSSKSFRPSNDAVRKTYNLLQKVKKHPCSGPFLQPVDVEGLGLHDYYHIVREPMDLTTVENKLKNDEYNSVGQLIADVRKIWTNAYLYNREGSALYSMTNEISVYTENLFKDVENLSFNDTVRDLERKVEMLSKQISELNQRGVSTASDYSKNSRQGNKASKSAKLPDKALTLQEKQLLGQNINKLPPDALRGVWDIVSHSLNLSGSNKEELEIDLETLPVSTARELERYVKNKIAILNRGKNKKSNENSALRNGQPASSQVGQHEGLYSATNYEEEDHQPAKNVEGIDFGQVFEAKQKQRSPSNSSESSFISDSDSEDEDKNKDRHKVNFRRCENFNKKGYIKVSPSSTGASKFLCWRTWLYAEFFYCKIEKFVPIDYSFDLSLNAQGVARPQKILMSLILAKISKDLKEKVCPLSQEK